MGERDRPGAGRVRAVLARAADLADRARAVLDDPERLRATVAARHEALREAEVGRRLAGTPVEDLAAGTGARVGALRSAGVRTAADVLDAGPQRLDALPGVGQATVRAVLDAALGAWAAVRDDVHVRLDPDRRDTAGTAPVSERDVVTAERVRLGLDGSDRPD